MNPCASESTMKARSILLGVNIDHFATLRQARYRDLSGEAGHFIEPDPVEAALAAERAGADGITVHPREDARHIQRADVFRLREMIHTRLNMEMACTDSMVDFAREIQPDSVCLVPENREEITTEGGLDVVTHYDRVESVVKAMREEGIAVSLFVDPDEAQVSAASDLGVEMVELHTGAFANHAHDPRGAVELNRLMAAAEYAHEEGLVVNAGHGINYVNVRSVLKVPHLHELNIGHSIICRAMFTGITEAVREMQWRMMGQ